MCIKRTFNDVKNKKLLLKYWLHHSKLIPITIIHTECIMSDNDYQWCLTVHTYFMYMCAFTMYAG